MSSIYNNIQWQEGMLLKPQHFQQSERAQKYLVKQQISLLHSHYWGFFELEFDEEALGQGYLLIKKASGYFQDGTLFSIPDLNLAPEMMSLSAINIPCSIYIAIHHEPKSAYQTESEATRYTKHNLKIGDCENDILDLCEIATKSDKILLLDDTQHTSAYQSLKIATLKLMNSSNKDWLDEKFIPSLINIQAWQGLYSKAKILFNLIKEEIESRPNDSKSLEHKNMPQWLHINYLDQAYRKLGHLLALARLHPERLFEALVEINAQLSFSQSSITNTQNNYDHNNLYDCFMPLIKKIKQNIRVEFNSKLTQIALQENQYGFWLTSKIEAPLLNKELFILIKNLENDTLNPEHIIKHLKIGTQRNITTLVKQALPGIGLNKAITLPSAIPYTKQDCIFKLEQNGQFWQEVLRESIIAVHGNHLIGKFQPQLWVVEP